MSDLRMPTEDQRQHLRTDRRSPFSLRKRNPSRLVARQTVPYVAPACKET